MFLFICLSFRLQALTWDEPWQDKVIKEAEHFIFGKIISADEEKGLVVEVIKSLAGKEIKGEIKITGFYMTDICSSSGGHGPEFHFGKVKEAYFFIKKDKKDEYSIATPMAGFAAMSGDKVLATYRHSYHQCLVSPELYEITMTAFFKKYHGEKYQAKPIEKHIKKYLDLPPAGFTKTEVEIFFDQHVALESIYHLRLSGYCEKIIPFLNDTANFHNQVSAARALVTCNTNESNEALLAVIADTSRSDFVKVLCIWSLMENKPSALKERLEKMVATASEESNGFGGNLMDPRVCTRIPSVKRALERLIDNL